MLEEKLDADRPFSARICTVGHRAHLMDSFPAFGRAPHMFPDPERRGKLRASQSSLRSRGFGEQFLFHLGIQSGADSSIEEIVENVAVPTVMETDIHIERWGRVRQAMRFPSPVHQVFC